MSPSRTRAVAARKEKEENDGATSESCNADKGHEYGRPPAPFESWSWDEFSAWWEESAARVRSGQRLMEDFYPPVGGDSGEFQATWTEAVVEDEDLWGILSDFENNTPHTCNEYKPYDCCEGFGAEGEDHSALTLESTAFAEEIGMVWQGEKRCFFEDEFESRAEAKDEGPWGILSAFESETPYTSFWYEGREGSGIEGQNSSALTPTAFAEEIGMAWQGEERSFFEDEFEYEENKENLCGDWI